MGGGRRFALADGYDIFYYESGRMAVGGLSAPVYGRKICEPGIFSWAVASDLWSRERVDFDLSAEAAKKTVSGISVHPVSVRRAGVLHLMVFRTALRWEEMVGLQRLLFESQWKNLYGRAICFWDWGNVSRLCPGTASWASVSEDTEKISYDGMSGIAAALCCRSALFRRESEYGAWNHTGFCAGAA